jgi:IS5 family transposase
MRFVGLALHEPVPDAKTVWLFREQLVRAGAVERLFARFDAALRERGLLAMGGQIVDATIIQARRARLTAEEKAAIRRGEEPAGWTPARRARIDRDARWTLRRGRRQPAPGGTASERRTVAIAVPVFGYKSHLGIDRVHRLIRTWTVTHAAAHDGGQLGALLDPDNTASGSGPTRPTARRPTSSCWPAAAASATCSAGSPGAGRCRATSPAATPPGARCGPRSSTCSPPRSGGSGW